MSTYNLGKIGMHLAGEYEAGKEYEKLDVVTSNGCSYAAKQKNQNKALTNEDYWQLMSGYEDGNGGEAQTLSLNSAVAESTVYCNGNLRVRKIGKHVYMSGGFHQVSTTGKVTTLPAGCYNPNWTGNWEFWRWGNSGSTNYAVKIRITPTGELYVIATRRINDNTASVANTHVDMNFDYWID